MADDEQLPAIEDKPPYSLDTNSPLAELLATNAGWHAQETTHNPTITRDEALAELKRNRAAGTISSGSVDSWMTC